MMLLHPFISLCSPISIVSIPHSNLSFKMQKESMSSERLRVIWRFFPPPFFIQALLSRKKD